MNRITEYRDLDSRELVARLGEVKEALFNLRFQQATGQLENYGLIGITKRDVARILSIQRERELGISSEPTPEEAAAARRRREEAEEAAEETAESRRARRRLRRGRDEEADDEEAPEAVEAEEEPVAEAGDESVPVGEEADDGDDEETEE